MDDRKLYRQKYQAQLDEWKADVAKLKARAAGAKADVQIEMNKHMKELDHKLHQAGARLSELAAAGEETRLIGKEMMYRAVRLPGQKQSRFPADRSHSRSFLIRACMCPGRFLPKEGE